MKKLLSFFVFSSLASLCFGWAPPDYSLNTTSNARIVQLSTTSTSPTLLLTKQAATRTLIYTTSMTFQTSFQVSVSTVFVSSGTNFKVPASTGPTFFTPDGVDSPWSGQLYAVIDGTTPFTVSVFQAK